MRKISLSRLLFLLLTFFVTISSFANSPVNSAPLTDNVSAQQLSDTVTQVEPAVAPKTNLILTPLANLTPVNSNQQIALPDSASATSKQPDSSEVANQATTDIDLKTQIIKLTTENELLRQQTKELEQRVDAIESKLGMKYHLSTVASAQTNPALQQTVDLLAARVNDKFGKYGLLIVILSGFLILLLLLYIFFPSHKKVTPTAEKSRFIPTKPQPEPLPDDNDYNLMDSDSKEGTAAKLYLARAYIAMAKNTHAENLLHDVIKNGNEIEQNEAQILLAKIKG